MSQVSEMFSYTEPTWRSRTAATLGENPFVRISNAARLVIVVYFFCWRILPEIAAALQFETSAGDIVLARVVVRIVMNILLLLPFFLYRFAGTPIGWLHPLVLPTMLVVAKGIVTNPLSLTSAVTTWLIPPVVPDYRLLSGQPLEVVLAVELKRDSFLLLAQVCYLAGFALLAPKLKPSSAHGRVLFVPWRFLALIGFCFAVFVVFIEMNGGLITHFSRLAYGRFLMSEKEGHFLVLISLLPYLLALWYAARPKNLREPWFIALFAPALLAQFATTGSRSSIVAPVILMLALWMLINRKTPALRIVLLGLFVTIFLGTLAELRNSPGRNAGVVDLSVLTGMDVVSGAQSTIEHRAELDEASGLIAVMYAVPERVPHLYGVTYLSSLAFFIPRTIWPEKPRGPGAHVGAIIYDGAASTQGYTGTSMPAGGVGEAYWNFGVLGVVFIYLLFGLFHRLIAHYCMVRPHDPFRGVVFIISMVVFLDASSDALVRYLQLLVLLYFSWLFVRRAKGKGSIRVGMIPGTMATVVITSGRDETTATL